MAEEQSPQSTNGGKTHGPRSELTRLGAILLGLALIIGATNNQAVKLTGQVLPELPAPGGLAVRVLAGLVGAVLLVWGLWGVARPAWENLRSWWRRRRAPRRPARDVGVPPDRNPLFGDRVVELAQLRERLIRGRRVALSGMGGVGKSQLAVEYLHRHHDDAAQDDYVDGVFWLRGESGATLHGDFAALAWLPPLELEERQQREQERVIAAVAGWLRTHERWLLVIDNLDDAAVPILNGLLGRGLKGHVLVTSRVPIWDPTPLSLEPMPPEVAVAFLLERSGQTDASAAAEVAEILGGLPLALVQAAGYLKTSGRDLSSYARLVRTRLAELLQEGRPEDYPLTVAATWKLSFERIEREQPAAAALLRLCAFVAADDIPLSLLLEGAAQLPENLRVVAGDELRLDSAVTELRRYALVVRQGAVLRVHRLVQAVVRDSTVGDLRRRWLGAAVRVLRQAFPAGVEDPMRWPLCDRLLPHAQVATDLVGDDLVEPRATSWLLDRVARYLQVRGQYRPARPLFERALAISEKVLGPDHPDTATSLNNLALLLWDQGDVAAARPLYERALAIREGVLGPDHPDTAASLDVLARALLGMPVPLAKLRSLQERALAIRERVLGPDHSDTAESLNNLALLLREQGELPAARRLNERALAIRERVLGPDHLGTAVSLTNQAYLLQIQGELAAARPLYERALAISEKVQGPDHPGTAFQLSLLANLLREQGELAAARRLLERAAAIDGRVFDPDHPTAAFDLNNLALLLQAEGELAAAQPLFERALAIRERERDPDHPGTAESLNNLASLLREQGELAAARPLQERAVAICERVPGPNGLQTAASLNNLASLLQAQGELAEARPLYQRALEINERVLGPDHPRTVETRGSLQALLGLLAPRPTTASQDET